MDRQRWSVEESMWVLRLASIDVFSACRQYCVLDQMTSSPESYAKRSMETFASNTRRPIAGFGLGFLLPASQQRE